MQVFFLCLQRQQQEECSGQDDSLSGANGRLSEVIAASELWTDIDISEQRINIFTDL